MLSKKERDEFIKDGYSLKRRENFRYAKKALNKASRHLDDYIQFLMGIQKIFSPFVYKKRKTITNHNKL